MEEYDFVRLNVVEHRNGFHDDHFTCTDPFGQKCEFRLVMDRTTGYSFKPKKLFFRIAGDEHCRRSRGVCINAYLDGETVGIVHLFPYHELIDLWDDLPKECLGVGSGPSEFGPRGELLMVAGNTVTN